MLPKEYILDFKSRFTYNSNKIEGSTITLQETVSIIKDDYSPSGKSIREIYEVINHSKAVDYILKYDDKIDSLFIKNVHNILMDNLNHDRGNFKENDNAIIGADFETTPAHKVDEEMKQYFDNLNYQLEKSLNIFEVLAENHIKFERIHPFSDGNGRSGRLLINKILIDNDIAPIVIEGDNKKKYYKYLSNQDVKGLSKYFEELSIKEEKRIIKFLNKEKEQIR